MVSRSASVANDRPFYARFAEAYDSLITDPVEPWVEAVNGIVTPRAPDVAITLLDAGCGTGRQASALARAGYEVEMVDASKELLAIAGQRCPTLPAHLADLTDFHLDHTFDVVACRGVLNDIIGTEDRQSAIGCLADHVRPGGHLVIDVRDKTATAAGQPKRSSKSVSTPEGELVLDNVTRWEPPLLVSHEIFTLTTESGIVEKKDFTFAMQPWTASELREALLAAGLVDIRVETASYRLNNDRLFVTATLT